MLVNVSELKGDALNLAVAQALGRNDVLCHGMHILLHAKERTWAYDPSTDWSIGGPIIEKERIQLRNHNDVPSFWTAMTYVIDGGVVLRSVFEDGPTPLIAAMRCFVASKLGDTIDLPDELVAQREFSFEA